MVCRYRVICLALVFLTFMGLNGLVPAAQAEPGGSRGNPDYQVFAFNDLGVHCYDQDFSVFSLLPPFNVIHAQVINKGLKPGLLNDAQIRLAYDATPFSTGSKNTSSRRWRHRQRCLATTPAAQSSEFQHDSKPNHPGPGKRPDPARRPG